MLCLVRASHCPRRLLWPSKSFLTDADVTEFHRVEFCMQVTELLGRERVIFVEDGIVSFSPIRDRGKNPIGNPGSLESALVDMALLSQCDDIVTTFASSFGYVAAAWGGIAPVGGLLLSPCYIVFLAVRTTIHSYRSAHPGSREGINTQISISSPEAGSCRGLRGALALFYQSVSQSITSFPATYG